MELISGGTILKATDVLALLCATIYLAEQLGCASICAKYLTCAKLVRDLAPILFPRKL